MTTEQLMLARWKVIADYPGYDGYHRIGDIVERKENYSEILIRIQLFAEFSLICPNDYPHLFKKLGWWEERTIDEMPRFIRLNEKMVIEVQEHFIFMDHKMRFMSKGGLYYHMKFLNLQRKYEKERVKEVEPVLRDEQDPCN